MSKEKSIVDWFDPHNIKHIEAYKELQDSGSWPPNFVPQKMVFPPLWFYSISMKIAECWIKFMVDDFKNDD